MATKLSNAARSAAANAIVALIDAGTAGKLRIYGNTQAAGPDTTTAEVLLAEFTLDATASFGAASNGVATLDATPALTATGAAAGTATWFRIVDSSAGAGAAGLVDGAVGTSGAELNLNTTTVSSGLSMSITSGTLTMPASS